MEEIIPLFIEYLTFQDILQFSIVRKDKRIWDLISRKYAFR